MHPIHLFSDPVYGPPDVHIPRDVTDDDFDDSFMGDVKGDAKPDDWLQLPDEVFEMMIMECIGITPTPQRPHDEPVSVLLPVPRSAAEEKELFEHVMTSLRKRVAELEEEELFESAMRTFTHRSTTTANCVDPSANILMVAGGGVGESDLLGGGVSGSVAVVAEPNAPGLGEQPRSRDVKELLRADIREVKERLRVNGGGSGSGGGKYGVKS